MTKAKITYIHQHFRLPSEGGGTRPWEFARRLVADGHTVTMICGGDVDEKITIEGLRVIRLRSKYRNAMSMFTRMRAFVEFMLKATWTASRQDADVVFASSTPLTVALPGILAAAFQRARFVFEVRDLWPSVPARLGYIRSRPLVRFAQAVERLTYKRADMVVALSPGMADGVLQTAPFAKVTVVPNAADTAQFHRTEEERVAIRESLGWEGKSAIYAGSFGETYRIPWLVRVAAESDRVRLQILGEGQATEESLALAAGLGLNDRDVLPGSVSKNEVANRMAASDLVISSLLDHPALHVNSLNKVFDALAAGKPVAFNHGGWLADLVVGAGAGWRLPSDPSAAAELLDQIASDDDALGKSAQAARELATKFDRDALYLRFRTALLGEPEGGAPTTPHASQQNVD